LETFSGEETKMGLLKNACLLVFSFVMLQVTIPRSLYAAPPDPVLEWIGIMNDTVLAGQTGIPFG
jgi:hypothetical protein